MLAKKYFLTIDAALRKVAEVQAGRLVDAARIVVDAVTSGGKFWVYDKGKAVTFEVIGRAAGLMMIQPLPDPPTFQAGDALLLSAVRNDDPSDAALVKEAKAKGVKVVSIMPFNPAKGSGRLQEKVDLAIDDYVEPGDGCLEVPGYASRICPTSGVANAAIAWAVCAEVVDELRRRGKEAHIYMSIARVGSREWNEKMRAEFQRIGY